MIEYAYVWIDLAGDIPIQILAKLKAIYTDEYRIYLATFCPNEFKRVLIENEILIPKNTFRNMISLEFKKYSIKVSQLLKKQNIELIGVLQKEYPQSLRRCEHCPTAIYLNKEVKENSLDIFSLKDEFINMYKLFMIEEKNEFNKEILDYIWPKTIYKKKKKYVTVKSLIFELKDVKKLIIEESEYLGIYRVGNIDIYFLNKGVMCNAKEKMFFSIIDGLILARVSNIEKGMDLVDYILEEGRDVFAVPGNILYKENYLANHVIKQGAYVVTNRYDMKNLI